MIKYPVLATPAGLWCSQGFSTDRDNEAGSPHRRSSLCALRPALPASVQTPTKIVVLAG